MSKPLNSLPKKLGKYAVIREVGRGGMGVVYEGHDPVIDRRVALKTLIGELFAGSETSEYLVRLRREAQAAGRLSHPNIVAVYDFGEDTLKSDDGTDLPTAFIAMEFIEGRELKSYLDAAERFPLEETVRIMSQLLDALEYSHGRGVVHRDIKPANIILLADGTVKVADFGIARIASSTLTQAGTVLGSPSYMSPEQITGQTVDGRTDLYSAGVVLYQMLAGEVPFSGSTSNVMHRVLTEEAVPPSILNVTAPREFDALLKRALAKRPADRFQSSEEFKQAIQAIELPPPAAGSRMTQATAGAQVTTVRAPNAGGAKPAAPAGIARWWVIPFAVVGIAVAAAGGYVMMRPHGAPPAAVVSNHDKSPVAAPTLSAAPPLASAPVPVTPPPGTAVVSAVGLADPQQSGTDGAAAGVEHKVWGDARRALIEKAAAIYVEPSSLSSHYAILRDKLLARSDDYISAVLDQSQAQIGKSGLMMGTLRATVKVRDVQRALNQIARDDRIEFVRNNGKPRIAVHIASQAGDDDSLPPQRSAAAENLLKERIESFGFIIADDQSTKTPADFRVDGVVRFKRLSARLPASGLTIEKFALTSWTLRAVDVQSGDEIYHDTAIPERKSWATQELALSEIGRLIGERFSKALFLQYFDFAARPVRLRFSGLPVAAAGALLPEVNATLQILNASAPQPDGSDFIIDTEVSGGVTESPGDIVRAALLTSLNRKLGKTCFAVSDATIAEIHVQFDASCTAPEVQNRLETLAPERTDEAFQNQAGSQRIKT